MQAILIAAGRSTRFWPFNQEHKATFPIFGKPLLLWTLESLAAEGGIEEAIIIHGSGSVIPTIIPSVIGTMAVRFAVQEEPIGTGNALYQARPFVRGEFALVWPDMVNAGPLVARMTEYAHAQKAEGVLVGAPTDTPWVFGIIENERGRVTRVTEKPARGMEKSRIKRVGVELLGEDFFSFYDALPTHHETDLVDAINEYAAARTVVLMEEDDVSVLKYPWDVFVALDILASQPDLASHNGAVIEEGAMIEGAVYLGEGARVASGASISGPSSIGAGAVIGEHSVLRHVVVGEGTLIQGAHLEDSVVGAQCSIGNGVRLSPRPSQAGTVQSVVKGERIDTGRESLGAMMGDNVTVESHATIAGGVLIGSNVVIGPGIAITENIEDGEEIFPRVDNE
jgi:bifunctional UDP-N-acetylglucosamine pyrophosphorylase/glucosamine-1-phosphate N-acetyltransferase